jgi:Ser/Thr protein kinase RdoA (MazF antagonist)
MEVAIPSGLWELYNLPVLGWKIEPIGSGHINDTYITTGNQQSWIVQKLNHRVFTQPEVIEQNIQLCQAYLQEKDPNYLFLAPITNQKGAYTTKIADSYWRIFPLISGGIAFDTLSDPKQAYEAAKKFGELSRLLNGIHLDNFKETIPAFHDLSLRFKQFEQALDKAPEQLKAAAKEAITLALANQDSVLTFEKLKKTLPLRIQHHDTKISNVLLHQESYAAVCVIDLDTLMPGYFLSDLGDMMRTYLCAYDENEADLSKISIREDYFKALMRGYLSEMAEVLSSEEKAELLFAGKFILYMQALRFLSDFLQGNTYYPISYPEQNLIRSLNQFQLLKSIVEKEKNLEQIIRECLT